VLSGAASSTLSGKAAARKDASHRLLQPTYSTSTGAIARFPRQKALCSTFRAGGGTFDAVHPASTAHSTLSSQAARRGAPHRRGASLWRRYQPLIALEARSLTPLVPKSGRARWVRVDCAERASSSPSRSTRGVFHQQVLPAPACAKQGTRHRFPGPRPRDQLPAPCLPRLREED
jgi:hypothetical protein